MRTASGTAESPTYAAGRAPGQRADRRDHAAVVLEVVVGVDDVVLAGVLVLGRDGDAPERGLHVGAGLAPVQAAAVGVPTPDGVHLGEVGVAAPVAGVDQRQQARPVRAGLGAEDPRGRAAAVTVRRDVGLDVLADVVVRLVQGRHGPDRVVEQRDDVRERVAEEAGDAHGDVDAGPAELRARDDLEPGDPPGRLVPHGAGADEREDLGEVVALGAHRARAPHREPDAARVLAGVGDVAGQQRVGERAADLPRAARRDGLRVDGVEVAAGRQHVDQTAGR